MVSIYSYVKKHSRTLSKDYRARLYLEFMGSLRRRLHPKDRYLFEFIEYAEYIQYRMKELYGVETPIEEILQAEEDYREALKGFLSIEKKKLSEWRKRKGLD